MPASIIDPIREEFLRLIPARPDSHPLGCHNPRIADAVVFDRLVLALVSGMGYERVADRACSATTIRRRRDEWIEAGVIGHLLLAILRAYDQMVGLELEDLAADGCITKAPSGGQCAGKSPVDRGKQGTKRSHLTDGYGIPVVTVPAAANVRDHTLLCETLDEFTELTDRLDHAPQNPALSLDAGYDYQPVHTALAEREIRPTHQQARQEDANPDRRPLGGRAHKLVDEQLRQASPQHRAATRMHRVLPCSGHSHHHRP